MTFGDWPTLAPLRLARFSVPRNRRAVWAECHCRARYSVAIDAIIASGTARVLLNHGGIGMPYVRNFCPKAHNSAARRERNRFESDSCDPPCGIDGWRGSAPRQLQHLVENQLNRLKSAAQWYRLPRRGAKNRANRNEALSVAVGILLLWFTSSSVWQWYWTGQIGKLSVCHSNRADGRLMR